MKAKKKKKTYPPLSPVVRKKNPSHPHGQSHRSPLKLILQIFASLIVLNSLAQNIFEALNVTIQAVWNDFGLGNSSNLEDPSSDLLMHHRGLVAFVAANLSLLFYGLVLDLIGSWCHLHRPLLLLLLLRISRHTRDWRFRLNQLAILDPVARLPSCITRPIRRSTTQIFRTTHCQTCISRAIFRLKRVSTSLLLLCSSFTFWVDQIVGDYFNFLVVALSGVSFISIVLCYMPNLGVWLLWLVYLLVWMLGMRSSFNCFVSNLLGSDYDIVPMNISFQVHVGKRSNLEVWVGKIVNLINMLTSHPIDLMCAMNTHWRSVRLIASYSKEPIFVNLSTGYMEYALLGSYSHSSSSIDNYMGGVVEGFNFNFKSWVTASTMVASWKYDAKFDFKRRRKEEVFKAKGTWNRIGGVQFFQIKVIGCVHLLRKCREKCIIVGFNYGVDPQVVVVEVGLASFSVLPSPSPIPSSPSLHVALSNMQDYSFELWSKKWIKNNSLYLTQLNFNSISLSYFDWTSKSIAASCIITFNLIIWKNLFSLTTSNNHLSDVMMEISCHRVCLGNLFSAYGIDALKQVWHTLVFGLAIINLCAPYTWLWWLFWLYCLNLSFVNRLTKCDVCFLYLSYHQGCLRSWLAEWALCSWKNCSGINRFQVAPLRNNCTILKFGWMVFLTILPIFLFRIYSIGTHEEDYELQLIWPGRLSLHLFYCIFLSNRKTLKWNSKTYFKRLYTYFYWLSILSLIFWLHLFITKPFKSMLWPIFSCFPLDSKDIILTSLIFVSFHISIKLEVNTFKLMEWDFIPWHIWLFHSSAIVKFVWNTNKELKSILELEKVLIWESNNLLIAYFFARGSARNLKSKFHSITKSNSFRLNVWFITLSNCINALSSNYLDSSPARGTCTNQLVIKLTKKIGLRPRNEPLNWFINP